MKVNKKGVKAPCCPYPNGIHPKEEKPMGQTNERLESIKYEDLDGNRVLPVYAWPGGYVFKYITKDGLTICSDCANRGVDQAQEVADYEIEEEECLDVCEDCEMPIDPSKREEKTQG